MAYFLKKYLTNLCHSYIPHCAAVTTVTPGMAREYQTVFGFLPEVVYSGSEYHGLPVHNVDEKRIKLVHHGIANKSRCIEQMIGMMDYLDNRFSLDLMLVGKGAYLKTFKQRAEKRKSITWREPVQMQELSRVIN